MKSLFDVDYVDRALEHRRRYRPAACGDENSKAAESVARQPGAIDHFQV